MRFPLTYQFENPEGFWVSAHNPSYCKRFAGAYRGDAPVTICGPSDTNGAALCSDSVAPGPGVRIPKLSDLDLTGKKRVKRGSVVSWHGLRLVVLRVADGHWHAMAGYNLPPQLCSTVQVIA